MLSGYEKIAKAARLPIPQSATPRQIAETVKSWLRTEESWLVVVDNLDEYEVAKGLLPENTLGKHTLITTRNPKTTAIPAESLEVPLLGEEDSIDLLLTLSTVASNPTLQQKEQALLIVEELGYLPLAILQAAAFIREVTGNISTYLHDYHKNRSELIKWPTNDSHYPHSVATTWSMSFTVLQANLPQAARLLQLFSFLNPDGILIDFLVDGAEGLDAELQQIVSSQVEMAKVLLELEKFSLIKWNREGKSIFIHRLVQLVVNNGMTDEERDYVSNTVIDLCLRAFPNPDDNRSLCRLYEPQIVKALSLLETLRSIKAMTLTANVAALRLRDGKFSASRNLFLRALHISTSAFGHNHEKTFQLAHGLANSYSFEGELETAVQMLEDLLPKVKECLGNDHRETLFVMDALANALLLHGRWNEAAELEEHAVGEFTRSMGVDSDATMDAKDRLAQAYIKAGRFEEAIELEEDLLLRKRRLFGEIHLSTLRTLQMYGVTLFARGRSEKAIQVGEEVMEKTRILLGDSHLDTVISIWTLAERYVAHGKAAEGDVLFREAKVLMTRVPADSLSYLKSTGIC
jgi:tetratricopeptide (TPR) repeat protein